MGEYEPNQTRSRNWVATTKGREGREGRGGEWAYLQGEEGRGGKRAYLKEEGEKGRGLLLMGRKGGKGGERRRKGGIREFPRGLQGEQNKHGLYSR